MGTEIPLVLVQSECRKHPGHFTLGGPCDICVTEEFRANLDRIFVVASERLRKAMANV